VQLIDKVVLIFLDQLLNQLYLQLLLLQHAHRMVLMAYSIIDVKMVLADPSNLIALQDRIIVLVYLIWVAP
jgi:hypothetical protein